MVVNGIKNQTMQIFQNMEILLECITESEFETRKGGFITWKHFYHLIHSLDKNFIDPGNYTEPVFHKQNMHIIYLDNEDKLTKNEVADYYANVKNKIQKYIDGLDEKILNEIIVFNDIKLTKLELILAQLRHIFYHIGYLHCCIKIEKGETPEYIGLYKAVPENEQVITKG